MNKLKILIVDDDETSQMILSIRLSGISREMLFAYTGEEAVELCRSNPDIDLIMMDIRLPGMDGCECTNTIRQFNKEIIIIGQTAYGSYRELEAIDAGCNSYIAKPIDVSHLFELIGGYFKFLLMPIPAMNR